MSYPRLTRGLQLVQVAELLGEVVAEERGVEGCPAGGLDDLGATVTSALVLGTVFAPTDLIGFALIIAMVFLTV